jgi:hypothetical protein
MRRATAPRAARAARPTAAARAAGPSGRSRTGVRVGVLRRTRLLGWLGLLGRFGIGRLRRLRRGRGRHDRGRRENGRARRSRRQRTGRRRWSASEEQDRAHASGEQDAGEPTEHPVPPVGEHAAAELPGLAGLPADQPAPAQAGPASGRDSRARCSRISRRSWRRALDFASGPGRCGRPGPVRFMVRLACRACFRICLRRVRWERYPAISSSPGRGGRAQREGRARGNTARSRRPLRCSDDGRRCNPPR